MYHGHFCNAVAANLSLKSAKVAMQGAGRQCECHMLTTALGARGSHFATSVWTSTPHIDGGLRQLQLDRLGCTALFCTELLERT